MNISDSQKDLQTMLEFLVEFATLMLRESGSFLPFASGMNDEGEMTSVPMATGDSEPTIEEMIGVLHSGLVELAIAGSIKASGICTDVRIHPPGAEATDAICVELEHRSGEAIEVFVPFLITAPGNVLFDEIIVTPGEAAIFVPVAG